MVRKGERKRELGRGREKGFFFYKTEREREIRGGVRRGIQMVVGSHHVQMSSEM